MMASVIYKKIHVSNLLTCNELFTIGKTIIRLVLYEVVKIMNNMVFKNLITWPMGQKMEDVILEFKEWCELSNFQGAIDDTHISISKPKVDFVEDYYFHKTKGYSIVV